MPAILLLLPLIACTKTWTHWASPSSPRRTSIRCDTEAARPATQARAADAAKQALQPAPQFWFRVGRKEKTPTELGAIVIGGVFILVLFPVFFPRFWLLGFSASWLFGFLVFRPLGFLAFWLLVGLRGFWWLFGFGFSHPLHSRFKPGLQLVYAAFGDFGFSHPLLSQFLSGSLVLSFGFPHPRHHQCLPI